MAGWLVLFILVWVGCVGWVGCTKHEETTPQSGTNQIGGKILRQTIKQHKVTNQNKTHMLPVSHKTRAHIHKQKHLQGLYRNKKLLFPLDISNISNYLCLPSPVRRKPSHMSSFSISLANSCFTRRSSSRTWQRTKKVLFQGFM